MDLLAIAALAIPASALIISSLILAKPRFNGLASGLYKFGLTHQARIWNAGIIFSAALGLVLAISKR